MEVLSHHVYRDTCSCAEVRIPIEPLVGFLRHPCGICLDQQNHFVRRDGVKVSSRWEALLTKSHLLPLWADELARTRVGGGGDSQGAAAESAPRVRSAILFDLGASTYHGGAGGSSLHWFVEQYWRRGFAFDRIFAWEATPTPDELIFQRMPTGVLNALSYYNVPIDTSTPGARHNPLRTLREMTRPGDMVVVKIDFDDCVAERRLVEQLLAASELHTRVTELYFEHHCAESPMDAMSWHVNRSRCNDTLRDSYQLFARLRAVGIRAHPWV